MNHWFIPENENPEKKSQYCWKNSQQKGKGHSWYLAKCIKILTPKQMLQRLPIALA